MRSRREQARTATLRDAGDLCVLLPPCCSLLPMLHALPAALALPPSSGLQAPATSFHPT